VVRTKPNLKEASRALVNLANERGGHDNITVVLIGAPTDFKSRTAPKKKNWRWLPWAIGTVVGLLFIGSSLHPDLQPAPPHHNRDRHPGHLSLPPL
jgi:hypothetical protein